MDNALIEHIYPPLYSNASAPNAMNNHSEQVEQQKKTAKRLYHALEDLERKKRSHSKYTWGNCVGYSVGLAMDIAVPTSITVTATLTKPVIAWLLGAPLATIYVLMCCVGNYASHKDRRIINTKEDDYLPNCFTFTRYVLATDDAPVGDFPVSQQEYDTLVKADKPIADLLSNWENDINEVKKTVQLPAYEGETTISIENIRKMREIIKTVYETKYGELITDNRSASYVMR